MKKWIFVGIILLLSVSTIDGGCGKDLDYNSDGLGTFHLHFNKSFCTSGNNYGNLDYIGYDTKSSSRYLYAYCYATGAMYYESNDELVEDYWFCHTHINPGNGCLDTTYKSHVEYSIYFNNGIKIYIGNNHRHTYGVGDYVLTVSQNPIDTHYITGNTSCVSNTDIYMLVNSSYVLVNTTNTSSYNFTIINNELYRLSFDNGSYYDFICNGTDMIYNYDGCGHCIINIYDNCANLLVNATTVIYDIDNNTNVLYKGNNNPIDIPSYQVNENDELKVWWSTWHGLVEKTCYAQFDHDINLYDPFVYWIMDVYVYDNESNPIEDANVDFNQDCVINGYPARNKYTDYDGLAEFTQCENKNANLVVSKDGYQTLSTSISGGWYNAYTNTYEISVVLQQDNTSTWDLINNSINDTNATEEPQDIPDVNGTPINVNLYFKDANRHYVTQINDSDPYVRCYYDVIAMKPVSMTLKFQKSMSGYWFSDVYTYPYTIDNNSYGYMNLSNDNFSDPDYIYRAYISDPSYPEYDRYVYLSVVNQTTQSETHYDNLTALCMFANTNMNGSIDYREEITGYAYVVSDNASLRNVSLELYDNSTLIDYVNLTDSSFDDDLYEWELGYTYSLSHNYSLILKGYNGSILDCDNVIAYNLVGNKLTIKVTDNFNHDLDHVYVYVEHYGSINTGWLNYGTFEGLPNGETRYKATKNGYRSGVWKSVNLTNENEVVTYQLIEDAPEGSVASVRLSDSDVKDIYYPFMYFLLIIILIGALMNVIN